MTSILPRSSLVPDVFRLLESFPLVERHMMRIEDYIEDGAYIVRAEMPGLDPEKDITVTVDRDVLTITGERGEESKSHGRSEFHYGAYTRSVTLPRGADAENIEATYDNGILRLCVPVNAPVQSRQIPVAVNGRTAGKDTAAAPADN